MEDAVSPATFAAHNAAAASEAARPEELSDSQAHAKDRLDPLGSVELEASIKKSHSFDALAGNAKRASGGGMSPTVTSKMTSASRPTMEAFTS